MKTFKSILIISCFSLLLMQCSTDINETILSVITPPIPEITVNSNTFSYSNAKEFTFETNKGSIITIPSNSLMLANGSELTKEAIISFQEYHTLSDIALSGIPMEYDSNGTTYDFISGGMFLINAKTAAGERVIIKPNAEVEVSLASRKEESFNFYKLNEETGEWKANKQTIITKKLGESNLPSMLKKASPQDIILDLNISSELKNNENLSSLWKVTEKVTKKKKNIIKQTTWSSHSIEVVNEAKLLYAIKLSNRDTSITTLAQPVLAPNELKKHNSNIANRIKLMKKDLASDYYKPIVVRKVKLKQFGCYNHDIYSSNSERVLANFHTPNNLERENFQVFQFDLTRDRMIVVRDALKFNKGARNLLVALLPNNEVAVLTPDEIKKLPTNKEERTPVHLTKVEGKTIQSPEDLHDLIAVYN